MFQLIQLDVQNPLSMALWEHLSLTHSSHLLQNLQALIASLGNHSIRHPRGLFHFQSSFLYVPRPPPVFLVSMDARLSKAGVQQCLWLNRCGHITILHPTGAGCPWPCKGCDPLLLITAWDQSRNTLAALLQPAATGTRGEGGTKLVPSPVPARREASGLRASHLLKTREACSSESHSSVLSVMRVCEASLLIKCST